MRNLDKCESLALLIPGDFGAPHKYADCTCSYGPLSAEASARAFLEGVPGVFIRTSKFPGCGYLCEVRIDVL